MTEHHNPEIRNQLKITNIIFYSLLSGLLLFFVIVMILIQNRDNSEGADIDKVLVFLVPVFGLLMMFLSRLIYNQMLSKYRPGGVILQKITYYRTAKIVSWALIEGACLFALVATLLTSNYLYTVVFIFLIGYFILMRPSKESLIREMHLNSEESDLILKS
jgi:predicted membrane channel-forming protein YqfA (hemolysin III family)